MAQHGRLSSNWMGKGQLSGGSKQIGQTIPAHNAAAVRELAVESSEIGRTGKIDRCHSSITAAGTGESGVGEERRLVWAK